jgi:hypothetical protein
MYFTLSPNSFNCVVKLSSQPTLNEIDNISKSVSNMLSQSITRVINITRIEKFLERNIGDFIKYKNKIYKLTINVVSDIFEEYLKEPAINIANSYYHTRLIDASENRIARLTPIISHINCIHRLHLENSDIDNLPNELGSMTNLYELRIHNTKIKELPESISKLKYLNTLTISDKNMIVPNSILSLQSTLNVYFADDNGTQTIFDLSNRIHCSRVVKLCYNEHIIILFTTICGNTTYVNNIDSIKKEITLIKTFGR